MSNRSTRELFSLLRGARTGGGPCSSEVDPNYQFAFELKYLKQQDADQLDAVTAAGIAQLQDYLRHEKLQVLPDLRAWLIVFVGPRALVVLPVEPGQ